MRIDGMEISASGMRAQRLRMELIANNLANVETTSATQLVEEGEDGQFYVRHMPYRRKVALFRPGMPGQKGDWGVSAPFVVEDQADFREEHDPGHQHAVQNPWAKDRGSVYFPNVNPMAEMVDMIAASRAYEANVTAIDIFKNMHQANLRILA